MSSIDRLNQAYSNCVLLDNMPRLTAWKDRSYFRKFLKEYVKLKVGNLYIAGPIANGSGVSEYIDILIADNNYSENKEKVRNGFEGKIEPHHNKENYQIFLVQKGNLFRNSWFRIFHMDAALWATSHPSTLEEDLLSHSAEQQNSHSM